MKKRAFIIHGWDFNPDMNWYQWLKIELEKKGFEVFVPEMPDTSEPKIDSWTEILKKEVKKADKETFFIGHSMGCQTIFRYLETLPIKAKIGGCVFVAGWFKLNNLEDEEVEAIANPWIKSPVNFDKIKTIAKKITVFLSSNDPYNCLEENEEIFEIKLGAKVIIQENKGHFTEDDGVTEVPEVLNKVLELAM